MEFQQRLIRAATRPPDALTPEEIAEFRRLVREETGVDMSETEAWNRTIELVALFRMLDRPMPEDPER